MAMKKRRANAKRKPVVKRKARLRAPKRTASAAKRRPVKTPRPTNKAVTPRSAREFISRAALPRLRRATRDGAAEALTLAEMGFETAKDQAAVVGSEIVSFVSGVTAERREAIANSSLLAQLLAKTKVADATDIDAWYQVYFDALMELGWVVQEREFKEYTEQSDSFESHKAILKVAAALMATASPAALALVTTTLEALQSMDEDNDWITIFNRESQHARVARFQVSLAEQEPGGQFVVRTMAFALRAKSKLTQVLFFKFRSSDATLRYHAGKVTINSSVLEDPVVVADLRAALSQHARDFIRTLPPLRR